MSDKLKQITLLLIAVLLTGCQFDDVTPPARPVVQPAPSHAASIGRLAYIGGDGNIYVTSADRAETVAITGDATTAYEGAGLSYQRIAWSPEGRLAYASVVRNGDDAQSKLYVVERPGQPARLVGRSDDHFVIYIYWSPAACPDRPGCRHLAYLIEEQEDIALRLVAIEGATVENRVVGFGWPFYFSWAPDGRSLLWHSGSGQPEARLALYRLGREAAETLPQTPGSFLAPAWSPEGRRWLGVVADGESSRLQSYGQSQPVILATATEGDVVFAWSPDGQQVAHAARRYATDPFYGPIHLFDVRSDQSIRLTAVGLRILAFFWSPDGRRLGYLTRQVMPEAEWMQWRVYDLATGRDRGFAAFQPTPQMRFIVASFNQYAQSHRFWSPDGRYLVYAGRREEADSVWLVDTWSEDGHNSLFVDSGSMGFWSWE